MKLIIEKTSKIVTLNGTPVRLWEGETESGIPVTAFVALVRVASDEDCSQFERELLEQRAPSAAAEAIPHSLVI